ncbi:MAG: DegT/DnrJ/EryC1/StrS family aminotransferase [Actinomycetota bacterium]
MSASGPVGDEPAFPSLLPLARPYLPDPAALESDLKEILGSGRLTNDRFVRALEEEAARFLGVRHCVAVSSCTAGLMLVLRAAGVRGGVVLPSFTFAATAHAAAWNDLHLSFADVKPGTLTLESEEIGVRSVPDTEAVIATHIYGSPCDVEAIEREATTRSLFVMFDAAHAFGARRNGSHVGGFGDAEVFSLTPTKPVVAGEGGIVATNNDDLARRLKVGRDYGNPGDYDCIFVGLNARMSEMHAALALRSLATLPERLDIRAALARSYRDLSMEVPGIAVVWPEEGDDSTFKDLTVVVDPDAFGCDAPTLADRLAANNVETRRYYYPPVHRMKAYSAHAETELPVTDQTAPNVLSLPLWERMSASTPERVVRVLERIHDLG